MSAAQLPAIVLGGPGPRLVGYIVDMLISVAAIFVLVIVFGMFAGVFPVLSSIGIVLSFLIVDFAYFPYFWAKRGQTPGMKVMNVKVVRDSDGGPISAGQAILRLIGYWISGAVFLLGYLWIFVDKRQRGWFDLIAGTVVVKA